MRAGVTHLRRLTLLSLGALLAAIGFVVILLPVPLPMVGVTPFVIGCVLLAANSRIMRRWIQRARHRSALLSCAFERFAARGPGSLRRVIRQTRPDALVRRSKMAARKS
jgi:hypothetical protein